MSVSFTLVDAFTAMPYAGNPAAVCVLREPRDDEWMQRVARETNLSETAFVRSEAGRRRLRWFSPTMEVDLCGHATLASAHVLWTMGEVARGQAILFDTRSGVLTAERVGDWIRLDFPTLPDTRADAPAGLLEALGVPAQYVGRNQFDYLVEVADEATVRAMRPDFVGLARVQARGVIVTSRSPSNEHDFVSRFFGCTVGVDEDPVTGSAHCCLGPYWGARLGKTEMVGRQVSARGGIIRVSLQGDRVWLDGQAVTVMHGTLVA